MDNFTIGVNNNTLVFLMCSIHDKQVKQNSCSERQTTELESGTLSFTNKIINASDDHRSKSKGGLLGVGAGFSYKNMLKGILIVLMQCKRVGTLVGHPLVTP